MADDTCIVSQEMQRCHSTVIEQVVFETRCPLELNPAGSAENLDHKGRVDVFVLVLYRIATQLDIDNAGRPITTV